MHYSARINNTTDVWKINYTDNKIPRAYWNRIAWNRITSAYRSPMVPELDLLRSWRDAELDLLRSWRDAEVSSIYMPNNKK